MCWGSFWLGAGAMLLASCLIAWRLMAAVRIGVTDDEGRLRDQAEWP